MSKFVKLLILLLTYFSLNISGQPSTNIDELYRNRHKVEGMTYGHPYTVIDRHNGDDLFMQTINRIRERIIKEKYISNNKIYQAYKIIYNNAIGSMPADGGMISSSGEKKVSSLALWAKDNAFIFLIGLDGDGNWMDTTFYDGTRSFNKRNDFRDRVFHPSDISNNKNAFTIYNKICQTKLKILNLVQDL